MVVVQRRCNDRYGRATFLTPPPPAGCGAAAGEALRMVIQTVAAHCGLAFLKDARQIQSCCSAGFSLTAVSPGYRPGQGMHLKSGTLPLIVAR